MAGFLAIMSEGRQYSGHLHQSLDCERLSKETCKIDRIGS